MTFGLKQYTFWKAYHALVHSLMQKAIKMKFFMHFAKLEARLANEGILEIEWDFPEDIDHEGCTQALAEQQQIGWNNFFKNFISFHFKDILMQKSSLPSWEDYMHGTEPQT